jgi:predicted GH43/DUF377 family glycosyl hydrolase
LIAGSSIGKAYGMGAYIFDSDPSFQVLAATPVPLGAPGFYEDNPGKVIFPGGMVVEDHSIIVAWGKNDKQIMITTFDREKLFDSISLPVNR